MSTKRIVVGAHYGQRDWLAQRFTAVTMAVYTVVLIVRLLAVPELNYGTWAGVFASGWMKVLTLVALIALTWHAWVGVRDIFMDYVKPTALRLALQVITIVLLLGYACWAVIILWSV
jgi:succinate dehydrogenase / fumarate reductase membrane anchor subunit